MATSYSQVKQFGDIEDATPHKLVDMLYVAAQDRLVEAKGQIDRRDISAKGISIGKAISIIEELRRTLNMESGGEIADNLHELYVYMNDRLLYANLRNDKDVLEEVIGLINKLQEGWRGIPEDLRKMKAEA
ncbi:unnamed protein product [Cyprideis torosa]|uniref:Uncharacterized protein n=1 Tax=Cyprideis torosa TaxID=163714 RepID=A0A7R8X126_9CRUS|nr:unnamed protein product [Cyprideis torosa]CAG0910862.1 unnamed protein product [Cyprideis torosa]